MSPSSVTSVLRPDDVAGAVVELPELGGPVGATARDLVEDVLHVGGELVGHLPREVLLQQPDDREGQPGRHQRGALLVDVAAVEDRADDRGVGRRAADLAVLELLDQGGLGVARGRLGLVALGRHGRRRHRRTLLERGQAGLGVVAPLGGVVDVLDVGLEEPVEGDRAAARAEDHVAAVGRSATEADGDRVADGVLHLGGDGAHPDQLVEAELLAGQAGLRRGAERLAGRPDRLVGLLGVLHLGGVGPRRVGQVLGAVELTHLVAGRTDRAARERRGVRTHVGDEAVLVEPLRDRHRHAGAHAELAAGLLLQRGGAEGGVRRAAVGLGLDRADVVRRVAEAGGQRLGVGTGQVDPFGLALQLTGEVVEVGAAGDADVVEAVELGREHPRVVAAAGVEGGVEVPVGGDAELHPLALAVDDQAGRDGLDAAGGQAGHDLLPQHRGDLVAVEAVEDAARLLGLDEVVVDLAGVLDRGEDRGLGDLVEDHPVDRQALRRLELVEEVPGDRLALAVLIGGEVEGVGVLHQLLQLGDVALLVARHDVVGLEPVVDVDREPAPRLVLDLGRGVRGVVGQVTDVTDRGLDDVVRAQVAADGAGLGRGLDDDELCHVCLLPQVLAAMLLSAATVAPVAEIATPRCPQPPLGPGSAARWHGSGPTPRGRGARACQAAGRVRSRDPPGSGTPCWRSPPAGSPGCRSPRCTPRPGGP